MQNDELLDLVDENDKVIGTVWKSQAHKNPKLIHREAGALVFTKNKEFLASKRSMKKKHGPGEWEIGPSGHVKAGENPKATAERELLEEVGLKGKIKYSYKLFDQYLKESRFFYVYYIILEKPIKVNFDKNEIDEVQWIKLNELSNFVKLHPSNATNGSYEIILKVLGKLGYNTLL